MSYTTYEVTGHLKEKVMEIFSNREALLDKRLQFTKSIGANEDGYMQRGGYIDGFFFKDLPPKGWINKGSALFDGKKMPYYYPSKRGKNLKKVIKKIDDLFDPTEKELKKLFYGNVFSFTHKNQLLGVGALLYEDRVFVEVATDSKPIEGMVEILRSEYNKYSQLRGIS